MIIDCISDLHGCYPKLEGGDLLIVAGDLTARDTIAEGIDFLDWLSLQKYQQKIVIPGNHDNLAFNCYKEKSRFFERPGVKYLIDSGIEFENLKIWGSPWTLKFEGMNPACMAFTCDTEEELSKQWQMIPSDVDILVTHSPPKWVLDETVDGRNVGSDSLRDKIKSLSCLKAHIFGHIHESYGKIEGANVINASHVNEHYKPVNKPVRVIL